jgi:hypothetical protein
MFGCHTARGCGAGSQETLPSSALTIQAPKAVGDRVRVMSGERRGCLGLVTQWLHNELLLKLDGDDNADEELAFVLVDSCALLAS